MRRAGRRPVWLSNDAQLRQLSLWGMGSLGRAEWPTLLVAATLIIPAALAVWWMASRLNLLQLGDEEAHYLGVNVQALQRWLLQRGAGGRRGGHQRSHRLYRPGGAAPNAPVAGTGPSRTDPGSLLAGAILLLLADTRPHRGGAGGDTGRSAHQPAGRPRFLWLVFRRENSDMVNEYCARGCHFTLVNDRLSTTSPSRCAAAR